MTPVSVTLLWQPAHLGADWYMQLICAQKKERVVNKNHSQLVQLTWKSCMSLLLGCVEVEHFTQKMVTKIFFVFSPVGLVWH